MTDIVNGLLLSRGRVLMALRSPSRRSYPGTWSFPGGHVERGETLEDALVRELSEEIGVTALSWSLIRSFDDLTTHPSHPVRFHAFVVDEWRGDPANLGTEHAQLCWVSLADAAVMEGLTFPVYRELFAALSTL